MIFLFYGDDAKSKKEAVAKLIPQFAGADIVKITDIDFNAEKITELSGSAGLFASKILAVLENTLEKEENRAFVLDNLSSLADSENIFVFLEKSLTKDIVKKFEKKAEKILELKALKKEGKKYDVFALGDLILARDKKNAWLKFEEVFSGGADPEATIGALLWKVKTVISSGWKSAFSEQELKKLSGELIAIFHDAHLGRGDIRTGIEKMILKWCK